MPSRPPKAVIYDLDGTLVDSAVTVTDIINMMRREMALPPVAAEFIRPLTSLGGRRLILAALGCDEMEVDGHLEEFRQRYKAAEIEPDTLFADVKETLNGLQAKGIATAICTNKPRQLAELTLRSVGINGYFPELICDGEAVRNKPAPDRSMNSWRAFPFIPARQSMSVTRASTLKRQMLPTLIFFISTVDMMLTLRSPSQRIKCCYGMLMYTVIHEPILTI